MRIESIREALRRLPFIPFVLRLNDGRTYSIPHPDFVALARRHIVVVDPTSDATVFLEPMLIASLEFASASTVSSNPDNGAKP